jgi:hypothetical protein
MKRNITTQTLIILGVVLLNSLATAKAGSFKADPGLQLYSLRDDFKKDVPGTLKKVQGFGIRLVELAGTYELPPAKFKELLTAHGLQPVSSHFAYERFRDDPEGVAREAKTLGVQYAGCAWITHTDTFDEKECRGDFPVRSPVLTPFFMSFTCMSSKRLPYLPSSFTGS